MATSLQSPASSPLALLTRSRTHQNFAPSQPLQQLRTDKKLIEIPLQKAIQAYYRDKMQFQKLAFEERISSGHLVALFMKGEHLLRKRLYGPGYYVQPVQDQAMRQTSIDLTSFYGHTCCTKMLSSNPHVTIKPGDDSVEALTAATSARPMVDYWESQWYTTRFGWREALHALQDGWYGHRVTWDATAEGPSARKINIEQYEHEDPGSGQCWDCQFTGQGKDFETEDQFQPEACPNCGSKAVVVQRSQKMMMPRITPGEQKTFGAPKITTFPFASARWDLAYDMEESPWAIIRQRILPGVVHLLLGDVIVPDSESSDDKDLDVIDALAYSGQPMEGHSGVTRINRTEDRRPTLCEMWLSPEDMAEIKIEATQTIAGIELPAGRLSNTFKQPTCFVGLNDFSLITGIYPESHRDQIVTGQWFLESDSGGGRGIQNTVSVQKRHNEFDGLIYKGLRALAVPPVMADKSMLTEDQGRYLFTPETNVWVNLNGLPQGRALQDAFYVPQPGNISGQAINYGQVFLRQMFQLSSLVVEFTEGILPVDNRTATGAQITANLANSLFGPMLLVKGGTRVRISEILTWLHCKYDPVGRYYPGKEGQPGQHVSGKSLKGKLIYELTQGSTTPITPFSQQSDVRAVIEAFQGIEGLLATRKAAPQLFTKLVRPFNINEDFDDDAKVAVRCYDRLEQLKSNLASGVRDPEMLIHSLRPPVALEEPLHEDKARWYSEFLDTEEGLKAPQMLRDAVSKMYWTHINLATRLKTPQMVNEGMAAGMQQAAMAAPLAMGQQALQSAQPQPEDNTLQKAQLDNEESAREAGLDTLTEAAWLEHEREVEGEKIASQERIAKYQTDTQAQTAKETAKVNAASRAKVAKKASAAK